MKLQAKFGPRAKCGGFHNMESLGCANRGKKILRRGTFPSFEVRMDLQGSYVMRGQF